MFNLLNLYPGAFGLDISDLSLKIAEIKQQKNQLKLNVLDKSSLDEGIVEKGEIVDIERLAKSIKKLVSKKQKIKTKQVIVSLPEEKSFVRVLQMPRMSKEEVKSAVEFEAENYIPFSPDKVYLDSHIIQSTEKDSKYIEVLLVALPKKTVDSYVSAIFQAGLTPIVMETESQATARAIIKGERIENPIFIADIGVTSTNFSVYRGSSLCFTSFIPFSSDRLTSAIAKSLKIQFSKAQKLKELYGFQQTGDRAKKLSEALSPVLTEFIYEIKKHIDYYQTHAKEKRLFGKEEEVKKLLLCGGGANLHGLLKFLSEETGLVVQKANPLVNLPVEEKRIKGKDREKILPYATAIGLALRSYKRE
jgi:type IV pilus assembly protein PilM